MPAPEQPSRLPLLSTFTRVNLIILCCLLLLYIALLMTEYLTGMLILLGTSLILAYVLLGPVTVFEALLRRSKRVTKFLSAEKRRSFSIVLVYLLFAGILALALFRVVPLLSDQIHGFARDLPKTVARWENRTGLTAVPPESPETNLLSNILANSLRNSVAETSPAKQVRVKITKNGKTRIVRRPVRVRQEADGPAQGANMSQILKLLQQYTSQLVQYILNIGTVTITGLVYALTALVIVFYMLQDGRALKEGFVNLMPTQFEAAASEYLETLHVQFYSFIRGQVSMSVIAGIVMFALLTLLGVKYAILLSVVFGIASIIPVIGPWFGLLPILLVEAFSEQPLYILNVLMVVGVFYLLKTYWLWPRMISRHHDVHPVIFIVTFLACLKTVSFLGILMSFPLATILAGTIEFIKRKNNAPPDADATPSLSYP